MVKENRIKTGIRLIDVARQAGVSRVAAGRVLLGSGADHVRVSEKAAKRIRKAARELGYQPNRSAQRLNGKTGNLIGVIVNTNAPEIEVCRLVALERLAWQRGYQLVISALPPGCNPKKVVQLMSTLIAQGAAGIISVTAGLEIAKLVRMPGAPVHAVYCGIPPVIGAEPGVVLDLAHGYRQAVGHFVATGRKRIGVLNVDWGPLTDVYSTYRLDAVREEAQGQGVDVTVIPVVVDAKSQTPCRAQAEVIADMLLTNGVDAILAYSDMLALRMLQVLQKRGMRIPEDMAICGLNNLEVAELACPSLTTIDERAEEVSAAMLELMLAQLHGETTAPAQRVIRPELLVRESA
jgi:DNA-binding LacI/PurR family transcriptional regulator